MITNTTTAHLTSEQIEEFGRELDSMREEVIDSRGERDRSYILRLIRIQRSLALAGRLWIFASLLFLPAWRSGLAGGAAFWGVLVAGVLMLALAKILENMEIGHNILHAQWDWMMDPDVQSSTWEWDHACPSDQWMHSHNVVHHTWTNVHGKDRDIGYGMLRVTDDQRWHPFYVLNPLNAVMMALFFEWFICLHDLELNKMVAGKKSFARVRRLLVGIWHKVLRQARKDFVLWPALGAVLALPLASVGAGPSPLAVLLIVMAANAAACIVRNVWTFVIIFCGHFPSGVHHFPREAVDGETRGGWYLRQLLGSCNIEGGPTFHVLSGNLSHQIEHHLFPDLPSNRYPELAPRVRALAVRYGLPYNTGSLTRQFGSTMANIVRLSLPLQGPAWMGASGTRRQRSI
ncbi:MAG TPA: acyl-CoA desaturase [Candidatus Binatia bacterium]|nr:acyl-CoA desaturase [Candidatus Binatia bacterium]